MINKKFKPFEKLEEKRINKKRIIKNLLYLTLFTIYFILVVVRIFQAIFMFNDYTKDGEQCKVTVISALGSYHHLDEFTGANEVEIVSTGEQVNTLISLYHDDRKLLRKCYPLGSEQDAIVFNYEGEKLVHLKHSMLILLLAKICGSVAVLSFILAILITTLRKIKNADKQKNIWLTKKRSRWIRFISVAVSSAISSLCYNLTDDVFWLMNFGPFIVLLFTIPLLTFFLTHYDYYIDLIPPNPGTTE